MPMDRDQLLKDNIEKLKTGTTTVSLVCSDGVILASDKRATMGFFIASKDVQKVFQIDERLGMTVAGSVADAQYLVRLMQAECRLFRLKHGRPMTVKNAASLLANMMFSYKFFPYYVQLLIAGVEDKPELYSLDPLGGSTEEKYSSTGSGSPMAYGFIEDAFKREGTIKDNLAVAAKAIAMAMRRDAASGEAVDVVTITKSGYKRLEKHEVAKLLES